MVATEWEKGMCARWMSATDATEASVVVLSKPTRFRSTQSSSMAWTETRSQSMG